MISSLDDSTYEWLDSISSLAYLLPACVLFWKGKSRYQQQITWFIILTGASTAYHACIAGSCISGLELVQYVDEAAAVYTIANTVSPFLVLFRSTSFLVVYHVVMAWAAIYTAFHDSSSLTYNVCISVISAISGLLFLQCFVCIQTSTFYNDSHSIGTVLQKQNKWLLVGMLLFGGLAVFCFFSYQELHPLWHILGAFAVAFAFAMLPPLDLPSSSLLQ